MNGVIVAYALFVDEVLMHLYFDNTRMSCGQINMEKISLMK